MRAAVVPSGGPAEVIEIRKDWPEPGEPGPGEVLIAVEAAGINPSDTKIRAAADTRAPDGLPYVAGREAAGTVVAVGEGVSSVAPGDGVFCFFGWGSRPGGHCEQTIVSADAVAKRPESVALIEAAAVPLAGLTALQGMQFLDPPPGEKVLVTAGAGGVGHYGVQLAVERGLHVVATAGPSNHEFVRGLGAAAVLDYNDRSHVQQAKGIRYMLDCVGGSNIAMYLPVLGGDARVAAVAGLPPELRNNAVIGVSSHAVRCTASATNMSELARLMEAGSLRSTVQEVFPLERVADAHRLLEGRHVRGKLVIQIARA